MEQFDQLLTCAICLDRYRNPKLLPCQHSFCMEPCMEGLINYVTRQVKCPECRAEHRIPYQGIAQYPTNVTLQRFLELHIEITGELPDPTSGQVMERCGVCSEKSYCTPCSHCDKKVCSDCKESHLEILRREIARVNNQVRRTLPRLHDALGVLDKNTMQLQQNCANIIEEVDTLYLRLSKALKDRVDSIKSEIDVFLTKEMRGMTALRANLEHEISNFDSNSEFAEKHINTEGPPPVSWDDNELMDTKDIFLRTMEFIRNFETEPGDYHRRVRFFIPQDPNQLATTLANLGELTINQPAGSQSGYGGQPPAPPTLGPGLMRSKSDHRVAAQFRQAEERYLAYGSDNNDDVGISSGRQRYFGERHNTTSGRSDRYSDSRRSDYDYDDSPSVTETGRRSRFRSRFMRHHDSGDSDNEPSNRSVRFQQQHDPSADSGVAGAAKKERQRVLDTEDAARGPLSGITRLADSPRVIKRIQEVETKGRKASSVVKPTPPSTLNLNVSSTAARPPPQRVTTSRQVSEEDEIAKIKKANKASAASGSSATETSTPTSGASGTTESAATRRENSVPSTPTSSINPRFSSSGEPKTPVASRQTSVASEHSRSESTGSATPTVEDDSRTRKKSLASKSSTETAQSPSSNATSYETVSPSGSTANKRHSYSRTTSPVEEASSSASASERTGRKVGRVSTDRFNKSASSADSSTSAESSTHSSPVRNTGAAFSTVELKNRFSRKSSTGSNGESASSPAAMATTTTRSRFGNASTASTPTASSSSGSRFGSSGAASGSGSSTSNGVTGVAPHRFQSRFLGRAGTPTAEASRGSENSQSSSSDDSSDSSDSDTAAPTVAVNTASSRPAVSSASIGGNKDRELARTDIGPLLARSAQARDSLPTSSSTPNSTGRQQQQTDSSSTTTSSYTPRSRANAASGNTTTGRSYGSSRFGSTPDASTGSSGLSRSRTGSALADDLENKYPLTSKYLNRSRANMAEDSTSSYGGGSSGSSASTPRSYSRGYQSRFLNKSKSSAALAPEGKDADAEDDDDDDDAEAESSPAPPSHQLPAVSGDERYPSGRSRYAALKDRRSRLARSKSSHEVVPADPLEGGDRTGRTPHNYGQSGGEVGDTGISSQEPTSPTAESGSGSSLSTWARYLKNKYGPRNKEAENGNNAHQTSDNRQQSQQQQRFSRSRSIGSTAGGDGRRSGDDANGNKDPSSSTSSIITSSSRHQYMQKRKVLAKFGTRGSEAGAFTWPRGVAVGPDNSIVVADSSNHRVQVFDCNGHFLKEFGYYGNSEGEFDCLAGVAVNRIGQYIIADRYNHRIQVFDPSGRFLRVFGSQGTTDGKFSYPWGVTTDALGFIYVCDKENHRVQVFQSDGTFVGKFGTMGNKAGQLEHPHYIAVSCTNRVIVSDSNNHRIQVFDVNGKVITTFGSEGGDEGQFKFPRGVAVDDQGYIIVADSGNNRIQVFTAEGVFVKAFGCWGSGDGEFKGLEGIAVLSNGNIVVCDRENHRIQMF